MPANEGENHQLPALSPAADKEVSDKRSRQNRDGERERKDETLPCHTVLTKVAIIANPSGWQPYSPECPAEQL